MRETKESESQETGWDTTENIGLIGNFHGDNKIKKSSILCQDYVLIAWFSRAVFFFFFFFFGGGGGNFHTRVLPTRVH